MIFLVVITISIFWYIGYKDKQKQEVKLQQYFEEIIEKQKALEEVSQKELAGGENTISSRSLPPKPLIATSTASTSPQAYRDYGLAVADALKPLSQKREGEVRAVLSAIEKNDPALLKPVTTSRLYHEQVLQKLSKITVPEAISSRHFKITSQVQLLVTRLSVMEKALSQPTPALENSELFSRDYLSFLNSIETLNQFFAVNEVEFSEAEKINIFMAN